MSPNQRTYAAAAASDCRAAANAIAEAFLASDAGDEGAARAALEYAGRLVYRANSALSAAEVGVDERGR